MKLDLFGVSRLHSWARMLPFIGSLLSLLLVTEHRNRRTQEKEEDEASYFPDLVFHLRFLTSSRTVAPFGLVEQETSQHHPSDGKRTFAWICDEMEGQADVFASSAWATSPAKMGYRCRRKGITRSQFCPMVVFVTRTTERTLCWRCIIDGHECNSGKSPLPTRRKKRLLAETIPARVCCT